MQPIKYFRERAISYAGAVGDRMNHLFLVRFNGLELLDRGFNPWRGIAYNTLFQRQFIQDAEEEYRLKLFVFNANNKEIVLWKN
ncbi:MAG: hypothetical protein F6K47_29815 [Symploca sp. SIO2E6]|nr:hypothetical protein [Symploca sp. SIO2E6]